MYIIKNISNNNIAIDNKILKPGKEMKVLDLDLLQKIIKLKYITVSPLSEKAVIKSESNITKEKSNIVITNKLAKDLMDSLFKLYLKEELFDKDIDLLKLFYKHIFITSKLNNKVLHLIDGIENSEELIEVLLNNIYPEFLKLYLSEDKNK